MSEKNTMRPGLAYAVFFLKGGIPWAFEKLHAAMLKILDSVRRYLVERDLGPSFPLETVLQKNINISAMLVSLI